MILKDHNKGLNRQNSASKNINITKNQNYNKVAVIDIETTGLDPIIDLILEIGIVELSLITGETKILFDSFVKEPNFGEEHRNSWIFNNSDIKFEDIENAPLFDNQKMKINEILNQYPITAFNKSFDLGFLKAREINVPVELPCIMETATNICKIPFPNGGSGYKWPKCQEAWDFLFQNSDYIEKHRAADDAIHEAKILFELYIHGQFPI